MSHFFESHFIPPVATPHTPHHHAAFHFITSLPRPGQALLRCHLSHLSCLPPSTYHGVCTLVASPPPKTTLTSARNPPWGGEACLGRRSHTPQTRCRGPRPRHAGDVDDATGPVSEGTTPLWGLHGRMGAGPRALLDPPSPGLLHFSHRVLALARRGSLFYDGWMPAGSPSRGRRALSPHVTPPTPPHVAGPLPRRRPSFLPLPCGGCHGAGWPRQGETAVRGGLRGKPGPHRGNGVARVG